MSMRHRALAAGISGMIAGAVLFSAAGVAQGPAKPPAQPPAGGQPAPARPQPPASKPSEQVVRDRLAEAVANAMDKAHGGAQFATRSILQCDLSLTAGESKIEGKLSVQINGIAARFDQTDGSVLMFDGRTTHVSPASHPLTMETARHRLLALRALVTAPFMKRDPNIRVSFFRASMIMGAESDGFRIDWRFGEHMPPQTLVGYADARKHELSVIGGDGLGAMLGLPAGEKTTRSVVFTDVKDSDGVLLPSTWWLYDWTEAAGVRGDRLGTATIANVRFPRADEVSFAPAAQAPTPAPASKP